MKKSCLFIRTNGLPCKAKTLINGNLCFRHDPDKVSMALNASRKGGENRALQGVYGEPITLKNPDDVKRFLGQVINAVWSEGVPVQVGSSMGFLTRCWLDAYEASDVIKRLDEIEEKLDLINP
ncbi:MAG: hypothetical protein G01um10145_445 [Microgenomates group bacterium Gr01-1014_5]|nr:MAG: hypothetical protein G01um10145_445 [Microgenomates group bacterium Gr01-1014_5]